MNTLFTHCGEVLATSQSPLQRQASHLNLELYKASCMLLNLSFLKRSEEYFWGQFLGESGKLPTNPTESILFGWTWLNGIGSCSFASFSIPARETKSSKKAGCFFCSSFLPTCLHATLVLSCKFVAQEKVFFYRITIQNNRKKHAYK